MVAFTFRRQSTSCAEQTNESIVRWTSRRCDDSVVAGSAAAAAAVAAAIDERMTDYERRQFATTLQRLMGDEGALMTRRSDRLMH